MKFIIRKNRPRTIIVALCVFVLLLVVFSAYLSIQQLSFFNLSTQQLATASTPVSKSTPVTKPKKIIPKDWGTVSSNLGFSLRYPYKEIGAGLGDDGVFQVSIFFPPSIISLSTTTTESLIKDIGNIGLYDGLVILVVEDDTAKVNFKSWIKTYLAKTGNQYGKDETVLSENTSATTFAGLKGYLVTRSIQGSKNQNSPHYSRKDTFINKGKFVYRISTIAPSSDTVFPRSGLIGKQYLQRADTFSVEVLKTFSFDGSTKTLITIPRISAPKPSGEASLKRDMLLSDLRAEPFIDNNAIYQPPSDPCPSNPSLNLDLSQSATITIDGKMADIHVYDRNGKHTGMAPKIPGIDFASYEEGVIGFDFDTFADKQMLSIRKNINGKIELVGKKYGVVEFEMRGDGNSCGIVDIYIPVTPYSVATLPMTESGDIGPFSYDIDGDGKQDFILSLAHPLLASKQLQLDAVINNMKNK